MNTLAAIFNTVKGDGDIRLQNNKKTKKAPLNYKQKVIINLLKPYNRLVCGSSWNLKSKI